MKNTLLTIFIFIIFNTYTLLGEKVIVIQPYTGIEKSKMEYVVRELKQVFPNVVMNQEIFLDHSLRNKSGSRFRADLILKDLSKKQINGIVVGLTSKDISTSYKGRADWGVMGLSYLNGNACVISTFRLKGNNVPEKYFKLAIHEIGHAEGLKHCPQSACYMRDAKGRDHLNGLHSFCASCKKHLQRNGWKLK